MHEVYEKVVVPVTAGGVANMGGVVASLGPLYFAFRKQSKTPSAYPDLFKEFQTRAGWAKAYKALVPSVKMAPLQSLGYSGFVICYTEAYKNSVNPEDPSKVSIPIMVAARAGFYSAFSETLLSVYYLKKMFDSWNHKHHEHAMNGTTFSRVFFTTLGKNAVANAITVFMVYGSKLQIDRLLDTQHSGAPLSERSPKLSAIAGFVGALGANVCFAPLVTLQTRVLESPQHTVRWHAQQILNQGLKVAFTGVGARAVAKAIQSAIGFGLVPVFVSALKRENSNQFFARRHTQDESALDADNRARVEYNKKY